MTHTVVYGPKRYQGVGIPNLWTLQGVLKLWLAIAHGDIPPITGCSLQTGLALHTIELGLPRKFFQQDYSKYGHLAMQSWLKHLWEFCVSTGIRLVSTSPTLGLAQEQDVFLMEQFYKFGYQAKNLAQLNLRCLWCHAIQLSDIMTGDGQRITYTPPYLELKPP
jgi:hypothetical protein